MKSHACASILDITVTSAGPGSPKRLDAGRIAEGTMIATAFPYRPCLSLLCSVLLDRLNEKLVQEQRSWTSNRLPIGFVNLPRLARERRSGARRYGRQRAVPAAGGQRVVRPPPCVAVCMLKALQTGADSQDPIVLYPAPLVVMFLVSAKAVHR